MADIEMTTSDDDIAVVTINRPERRNALSANTLGALHRILDAVASQPEVRAVVITGAGSAFCSGADMKATPDDMNDTAGTPTGELARSVSRRLCRLEPVR